MKIKLFTHNDLDGVGCAILIKLAYEDVSVEYCDYNNINTKIKDYIETKEIERYDFTYITDISPNEEVAGLIESINKTGVQLIDHHKTSEWLNRYEWATVKVLNNEISKKDFLESGTSLFYNYLKKEKILKSYHKLDGFVSLIRLYDTWEWNKFKFQLPKDLNDIFWMIGIEEFVNHYLNLFNDKFSNVHLNAKFELNDTHELMIKYKRKEINNYIENKIKLVKVFDDEFGNRVAFVVADNNISELGNCICKLIECDYACIYTGFNMSLRSIGDFDVSIIAKENGGGGHKNASGMPVVKNYIDKYVIIDI